MVSSNGVVTKTDSSVNQIVTTLGEVTGESPADYFRQIVSNPMHDLAIPSPQAVAVLGKLKAKYGFSISRNDITKTKKGSFCSVSLLADLVEHKTKQ